MTKPSQHRGWSSRRRLRAAASCALVLAILLLPAVVATPLAQAQAYTTFRALYAFTGGTDGEYPHGGVVRDAVGNFYGTTALGGISGCRYCGTVFKLSKTGKETVLHRFPGTQYDGVNPLAGLVRDKAGNLYGTTYAGGTTGNGTVFKVEKTGKETVLHSFTGTPDDGRQPQAGLVRDAAGNLYGTTTGGGPSNDGTVFKLDKTGKETVLYSFTGGADGIEPWAGLVRDAAGNFYGTTSYGGSSSNCSVGCGTVFKLDRTGKETVLYSFTGPPDGEQPLAGLVRDAAGNLRYYLLWRHFRQRNGVQAGYDRQGDCAAQLHWGGDGFEPWAGLVRDAAGNLYGTTTGGGTTNHGTVFKLDTSGTLTVLYSFTGGADGAEPFGAGLFRDAAGNFFGETTYGGDLSCNHPYGCGVVFKLAP